MNWESLIGSRMRPAATVCEIEDAAERNKKLATKKWRKRNYKHYMQKKKEWLDANPDKKAIYAERRKPLVKKWAEEHKERVRELGRKSDRKREKTEKRMAWKEEYSKRPEVKARRYEQNKARELKPERIAWKKAYEEKRKNDPKRIAWKKAYNERKKLERHKLKEEQG